MQIPYQTYRFTLEFEHKTVLQNFPPFFLRSVIGKELRKVACLFPNSNCTECSLNEKCAYAFLFETPLPKQNLILAGRNHAPHPFVMDMPPLTVRRGKQLEFELILMGKGREYFPYFYYAILKAGEEGLFFQRMPYRIENVFANGESIIKDQQTIVAVNDHHRWGLNNDLISSREHALVIEFVTPFRYKKKGKYQNRINYEELIQAIYSRIYLLAGLYGELNGDLPTKLPPLPFAKKERSTLVWKDYQRYSARQRTVIRLGGIMGTLFVEGKFTPLEMSLLQAGQIFHIGKNAGFGLGKIEVKATTQI